MIAFYENRTDDLYCRDNSEGKKQLRCAAHLHSHIELVLFLGGHATAFCDTERVDLQAGDIFITFPNQIHRYEEIERERYILFIVNPDLMPEFSTVFSRQVPKSAVVHNAMQDEALLPLLQLLLLLPCSQRSLLPVRLFLFLRWADPDVL